LTYHQNRLYCRFKLSSPKSHTRSEYEKDISTIQSKTSQRSRVQEANVHQEWQEGLEQAQGQGKKEIGRPGGKIVVLRFGLLL